MCIHQEVTGEDEPEEEPKAALKGLFGVPNMLHRTCLFQRLILTYTA